MRLPWKVVALLSLLLATACAADKGSDPVTLTPANPAPVPPAEPTQPAHDAVAAGRMAFVTSCSTCHASGDGLDLAFFHFTDTTIIRRAVAHVDTSTAHDIVAYVRTLTIPPASPSVRIFQPGGSVLSGDIEFATRLFGTDQWPASLTTAQLIAIDPRSVSIAVPMPLWADESSNMDWMPDKPLPDAILGDNSGAPTKALAVYHAVPTTDNLVRAVAALRTADRRPGNPGAPCLLEDSLRVDYAQCFQVRRWTATLVGQHMVRFGITTSLDPMLHDTWWDVGNDVRKSLQGSNSSVIENAHMNWASWMYLGWSFDPSRHPSVYTGGGFNQIGLPRHAAFIALRTEVARPSGSFIAYKDVKSAANFAPTTWTYNAVSFGFRHLLDRIAVGDAPKGLEVDSAKNEVMQALQIANRKLPLDQRSSLSQLADQVLAKLGT
jgi:hypothetical protein